MYEAALEHKWSLAGIRHLSATRENICSKIGRKLSLVTSDYRLCEIKTLRIGAPYFPILRLSRT
jgi:hypothetical protein